jgi:hypothetical protein
MRVTPEKASLGFPTLSAIRYLWKEKYPSPEEGYFYIGPFGFEPVTMRFRVSTPNGVSNPVRLQNFIDLLVYFVMKY